MKTYLTSLRHLAIAAASLIMLAGCASISQIEVNRKAPERAYRIVNVISGPEQAGDVSAALEAALQQHGFVTRVNASAQDSGTLVARFKDIWKRNGVTYLNQLSIELVDADSKALIVSSAWKNSGVRQYQSVPEVVDTLVSSMLSRLPNNYKPVAKAPDNDLKTVSLNAVNQKQ